MKRAREEVKMGENEVKCPWGDCTEKFYGISNDESVAYMRQHVEGVHMAQANSAWNATMNKSNDEIADRNVSRVRELISKGFTRRESLAVLGAGASLPKMQNRQEGLLNKDLEFPKWAKDQNYESWKTEFEVYRDMTVGHYEEREETHTKEGVQIKEEDDIMTEQIKKEKEQVLMKIKMKMIATLKECENTKVKDFIINSVMNNNEVKESIDNILQKLDDRFGMSKKTREKIAREEFHNFNYSGSTSDVIDRMNRLRKKLHAVVTSDSKAKNAEKTVFDKLMLQDFLAKMKDLQKIHNEEHRRLEKEFLEAKYDWESCMKIVRSEVI